MPIRFTSPSLGGQRLSFLRAGDWQFGVAWRYLRTQQFFVGSERNDTSKWAPGGQSPHINLQSVDLGVTYGISRRLSLALTVPFVHGTESRLYSAAGQDSLRHEVSSTGLSDITLVGTVWLFDPERPKGNVALGLGIKTPTGNNKVTDQVTFANSTTLTAPVDQATQLGDGGWGILLQVQAFHQLFNRASVYGFGHYQISLRQKTDVPAPRYSGVTMAVPDVYTARAGVAYDLWPSEGVSLSLGLRTDATPVHDLLGGADRDSSFRRPAYVVFADPGFAIRRGRSEFTFTMPMRVAQKFRAAVVDQQRNQPGRGDLAPFLIFAAFSYRP